MLVPQAKLATGLRAVLYALIWTPGVASTSLMFRLWPPASCRGLSRTAEQHVISAKSTWLPSQPEAHDTAVLRRSARKQKCGGKRPSGEPFGRSRIKVCTAALYNSPRYAYRET